MSVIKIQALVRGFLCRSKRLPIILYHIQRTLKKSELKCSTNERDGRINSCTDENTIIKILKNKYGNDRIYKAPSRFWYDVLVKDYKYGWLPVNIKSSKITTAADNVGNLAMCLYAYTENKMVLRKSYHNNKVYKQLISNIKNKNYSKHKKKDYYFIVVNKNNPKDVIINSLKGLTNITGNLNNLPFQVRWRSNRNFVAQPVKQSIVLFIKAIQEPKKIWKEEFLYEMRQIPIHDY